MVAKYFRELVYVTRVGSDKTWNQLGRLESELFPAVTQALECFYLHFRHAISPSKSIHLDISLLKVVHIAVYNSVVTVSGHPFVWV